MTLVINAVVFSTTSTGTLAWSKRGLKALTVARLVHSCSAFRTIVVTWLGQPGPSMSRARLLSAERMMYGLGCRQAAARAAA